MITDEQLSRIMPHCPEARRALYLPHLQSAMSEYGISGTVLRAAMFLAQIAHESGELRWMEELASGSEYEGRHDLGNTQPGDGKRFKGRGAFMLTGRANYAEYGRVLGVDLLDHPEEASTPALTFRVAGLFWTKHGLNAKADSGDIVGVTRAINGGTVGLSSRQAYYERAKQVLG